MEFKADFLFGLDVKFIFFFFSNNMCTYVIFYIESDYTIIPTKSNYGYTLYTGSDQLFVDYIKNCSVWVSNSQQCGRQQLGPLGDLCHLNY